LANWLLKIILVVLIMISSADPLYANYQQAQAAYARRDYVAAAGGFFQAYAYPKNAGDKAKAEWGLAQSLHRLNLFYSASKYYSVIVRRGPVGSNPFFRKALEELGNINSYLSLGQAHIVQLFNTKLDPAAVPGPARGFYFYYLGIEAFGENKFEKAESYFDKVPAGSPYHVGAMFHLGVIANLSGRHSQAISYLEKVVDATGRNPRTDQIRELALINIARVHYETRRYRQSIEFYAQIARDSDYWLEAIWEASWAFFLMQKPNNTLGNIHTIHSPFFENRFFPESYILRAITFLRQCRYDRVRESLKSFRDRYSPVFNDVKAILSKYQDDYKGFFRLVYDYRIGSLNRYRNAWEILDKLSRTDAYREAGDTVRFADREINRLRDYGARWQSTGLQDELRNFLVTKKTAAISDAGRRLYKQATGFYGYLRELSDQTGLIQAEQMLGKVDQLRSQIKVGTAEKKVNFIGGMQELNVAEDLEFWPFEGEYWEDELGGYVYNVDSKCQKSGKEE